LFQTSHQVPLSISRHHTTAMTTLLAYRSRCLDSHSSSKREIIRALVGALRASSNNQVNECPNAAQYDTQVARNVNPVGSQCRRQCLDDCAQPQRGRCGWCKFGRDSSAMGGSAGIGVARVSGCQTWRLLDGFVMEPQPHLPGI